MKAAKVHPTKAHKTSSKKIETSRETSTCTSSISDGDIDHGSPSRDGKVKGLKHHNLIRQDSKSKSTVNLPKPSGSSFMKPTASHLAKQNKECGIHSGSFGRLQKPLVTAVEKLRSPTRCQNQATKRQKLEFGYLRKVAQLKHRASFLHKIVKEPEDWDEKEFIADPEDKKPEGYDETSQGDRRPRCQKGSNSICTPDT